jgi:phospholipid transport system substrate-binding protein
MKKFLTILFICFLLCVSSSASERHAMPVLKKSIDSVINMMKDKQKANTPETKAVQRKKIFNIGLELFDFDEMAQRTLGKDWKQLSNDQKKQFSHLFARFLANIYYQRLEEYTNETVKYLDERQYKNKSLVKTIIVTQKNEIPMDYKLIKSDRWRVYDISIEGVSLVRNYRTQFNKILIKQGIEDLMRMMQKKLGQFSDL